jgi:hypothetical protein
MATSDIETAAAPDLRTATAALITGCWSTQVIYAAVELGIADELGTDAKSAAQIAKVRSTHPRATFRLLRAMASLGLCTHLGGDRFELTAAGRLLRRDVPGSLVTLARHWGSRTWPALTHLPQSVTTGAAWAHGGREGFLSMAERPDEAAVLNRSMVQQTLQVARSIVDACDLSHAREVIDLGGGYGALLSVLLESHPQLRGATADLAYMERDALAFLRERGVGDRGRFIGTDFFESVPAGADIYLLKYIIHDWADADAIAILRNTRRAAGPSGRVLIIERVIPERVESRREHATIACGDVNMMVATGGLERTAPEYEALLDAAGLKLRQINPTTSEFSILEAGAA